MKYSTSVMKRKTCGFLCGGGKDFKRIKIELSIYPILFWLLMPITIHCKVKKEYRKDI